MSRIKLVCVGALMFSFSLSSNSNASTSYAITGLVGLRPSPFDVTFPAGVNSHGQVTGYSDSLDGPRAFLWTPIFANGTSGSMVSLGELPGGIEYSSGEGINDFGQVVGWSEVETNRRAFLWTPSTVHGASGTMIDLGDLPGGQEDSFGWAINSNGQVVGNSFAEIGYQAFLWTPTSPNGTDGTMINLGNLPSGSGTGSTAYGINSFGQIVGYANAQMFSISRPFLWTPTQANGASGEMVDLGGLGGGGGQATDINSFGQVIGSSAAGEGQHAFLWTPDSPNGKTGVIKDLGTLPGITDSTPNSINSSGVVVGNSFDLNVIRPFLWVPSIPNGDEGTIVDLNTLLPPEVSAVWELVSANSINDSGQIVGNGYFDPDGSGPETPIYMAYLLTVVPEPHLFAIAGSLVLLIGCSRFAYSVVNR